MMKILNDPRLSECTDKCVTRAQLLYLLFFKITLDPQYEFDRSYIPIELEITQLTRRCRCLYIKSNEKWFYSHCIKFVSWRTTGVNFSETLLFNGSQSAQVYSLNTYNIANIFNFFILDVQNYSGKVTLNFFAEPCQGHVTLFNGYHIYSHIPRSPIDDDSQIGMIKTIDTVVEPNKKYVIPFYLLLAFTIEKHQFRHKLQIEPILFNDIVFNKPKIDQNHENCNDLEDQENLFHHEIIARAQETIEPIQNSQISIRNSIPYCKKVLLYKKLIELGLQINSINRIYIDKKICKVDINFYGQQFFTIFDKNSHQRCKDIESKLLKKPNYKFKVYGYHKEFDFVYNSFVDLNLNEIGADKIIFFNLKLSAEFEDYSFGKY